MAVEKGLFFFMLSTGQEGATYVRSFRMYYYGQNRKRAGTRPLVARRAAITSSLPQCTILQLGLWCLSQPVQYTKHGGLMDRKGQK